MDSYFDLISIIYGFIAIQTLLQLYRDRSGFWDERVTSKDRELTQRLAIFFLIPVGVFLHEVGHSLATWQVGGTVVSFQWRIFWGYIIPAGNFSPVERWWIAFSGNLVSILLGLLPILFIPYIRKRIASEIAYYFACAQSVYSLVGYPLLSFTLLFGDWLEIYDFSIQPYASLTLIAHVGLLWGLWQLYHGQSAIRWRLARSPKALDSWKYLKTNARDRPNELQPSLELAYFLLRHNEIQAVKKIGKRINQIAPDSDRIRVFQAAMKCRRQAYHQAIDLGQKLLDTDLLLEDRLLLYRVICFSLSQMKRLPEVVSFASEGLAIAPEDYQLRQYRAVAYQMMGQDREARADIDIALENAPDEDSRQQIQQWAKQHLKLP